MGFSIRTNVGSLDAQRNLFNSQSSLNDSFAKLSSGFRITKAGDDAAGDVEGHPRRVVVPRGGLRCSVDGAHPGDVAGGGSEGIGKGIAWVLAKEGVDVAICARRKDVLESAAAEISKATGRKIVPIVAGSGVQEGFTRPSYHSRRVRTTLARIG